MAVEQKQLSPVQKLKRTLNVDSVQEQFNNALADSAPLFVASLIDVYSSDKTLQRCNPNDVIMEALKAATLKLPINKNLGFAYIVPYGDRPTMQIGYKGLIQLAQRTGEYKYINADLVYEGELRKVNKLTGEIDLNGEKKSDQVIGYFAYLETLNGFSKTVYWTKDAVTKHAKKYSKSFNSKSSPWQTEFDSMALKTVLRNAISKWGVMSVEMQNAIDRDIESEVQQEVQNNANREEIDIIEADFTEVSEARVSQDDIDFGDPNGFTAPLSTEDNAPGF